MITQMEAISNQPSIPELPIGGFVPNNMAIQIRGIDGINPVKAEIALTPYATGRGSLDQGDFIPPRNIVLTLGLNPNWQDQTIASLRRLLYRYFSTGMWVKLRFLSDDMETVYINGKVESFEPNIFSEDPEMQISIICNKPDLIAEDTTLLSGISLDLAGVDFGALDFFSGMSAVDTIDYEGTAPAGMVLRVTADYSGSIALFNTTPDGKQFMQVGSVVVNSGQRFEVNTVRTTRYVHYVNPSTDAAVNILAKMTMESDWPEFSPGANKFAVYTTGGGLAWTLGYLNRYSGL